MSVFAAADWQAIEVGGATGVSVEKATEEVNVIVSPTAYSAPSVRSVLLTAAPVVAVSINPCLVCVTSVVIAVNAIAAFA